MTTINFKEFDKDYIRMEYHRDPNFMNNMYSFVFGIIDTFISAVEDIELSMEILKRVDFKTYEFLLSFVDSSPSYIKIYAQVEFHILLKNMLSRCNFINHSAAHIFISDYVRRTNGLMNTTCNLLKSLVSRDYEN